MRATIQLFNNKKYNEKDNKTTKIDSDDENSFTETNKTDNNFIKDDLINFNIKIKNTEHINKIMLNGRKRINKGEKRE